MRHHLAPLCVTLGLWTLGLWGAAIPALAAPNQLSEVIVTVEEDDQPLVDVLRRLERAHGLNYVVAQDVLRQAGTVTVHLKQVPLDVALDSICAACGLSLEIRGPVLIIVPRAGVPGGASGAAPAPLPRVDEGVPSPALVEQARERQRTQPQAPPQAGAPAAPERVDEPDLAQAVGTLLEIDRTERRLVLRVDGLKRDFYLPEREDPTLPGLQIARLDQALESLKPGTRIAILYRRDAIRPVVTDLVGGAFSGTAEARQQELARHRRARERREAELARAQAGDTAPVATPQPVLEEPAPAPGTVKVIPSGPAAGETAAPEGAAPGAAGEEGILAGKFLGLEGDQLTLQRASDGLKVTCWLPPESEGDRRKRVAQALGELEEGAKIYLTFELREGKRVVTNTITESR